MIYAQVHAQVSILGGLAAQEDSGLSCLDEQAFPGGSLPSNIISK